MEHSGYALARDIAVADENSAYLGVERRILMENAGAQVARFVEEKIADLGARRVVVLAGPGNNGGDAMVAARHIAARGAEVHLLLLTDEARIRTPEARANWEVVKRMPLSIHAHQLREPQDVEQFLEVCRRAEIVIDGIFGTGVRGEVRDPARSIIEAVNKSGATVFSIDVPSGMDPDTGTAPTTCIEADYTITLHRPKPFMTRAERRLIGEVAVRGIGIPPEAEVVAGPGDLSEALRHGLRGGPIRGRIGDEDMAQGVRDTAHLLGLEPSLERVGRGYAIEVGESMATDDEDAARRWRDALYALLRPDAPSSFRSEVAEEVKAMARRMGAVVYVAGGVDYISDGERVKTNWLEPALPNPYCLGAALTIALALRSQGPDRLYVAAGSAFAVRRALRELGGSFSREGFLSALRSLISASPGTGQ